MNSTIEHHCFVLLYIANDRHKTKQQIQQIEAAAAANLNFEIIYAQELTLSIYFSNNSPRKMCHFVLLSHRFSIHFV